MPKYRLPAIRSILSGALFFGAAIATAAAMGAGKIKEAMFGGGGLLGGGFMVEDFWCRMEGLRGGSTNSPVSISSIVARMERRRDIPDGGLMPK